MPTEDGPVVVPLEDFCVVMVNGQVVLMAEVNLPFIIIPAVILGWGTGAVIAKALGVKGVKAAAYKISGAAIGAWEVTRR